MQRDRAEGQRAVGVVDDGDLSRAAPGEQRRGLVEQQPVGGVDGDQVGRLDVRVPPQLPEEFRRSRTRGRGDQVGDDPRELGADVLLEEVPAAAQGRVRPALRARDELLEDPVAAAGDRVPSLKAVRNGLSQRAATSQAARLAAAAGSSGGVGTRVGKARAPAL